MGKSAIAAIWLAPLLAAAGTQYEQARKLYNYTEYEAALKLLLPVSPKDGAVHELIGKNYYMLGDYKKASEFFEKAVAANPDNSAHYHWLGKAFGRRAETSSPFTAPGYASKARQNFEKAVQLDPKNQEAVNDLFEYYLEAPGFLGGGLDKAAKLAEQISAADPIEGYYAQSRLAEKRKEFGKAEQQLRRAAELAPTQVGRVIDLAKFLAKEGRYQESDQTFQRAERIAPENPKLMFAKADTYIRSGRNLEEARQLLKRYLSAKLTPEDPPRSRAEQLLKQASGG
jgi:tetratricopeptide (TPR) repeat protein